MDKDKLLEKAGALDTGMWKNLLGFDKMLTPVIIKIVYFLLLLGVLLGFVFSLINGQILPALGILVFGTLWVRVVCESLILMFRIHDQLSVSAQYLKEIKEGKPI